MRAILVFFTLLSLGCQHIHAPRETNQNVFSAQWIQSTEPDDYYFQPPLHRMRPLVYNDSVIEGNGLDNITAYDAQTGRKIWRLNVSGGVEGGAALDGNTIYFGGNDGNFYAVNADNGNVKWKIAVNTEILAAPLVTNDKIYFIGGNNIVQAMKKSDGTKLWAYHRQQTSYFSVRAAATPLLQGGNIYVGSADGFFVALSASSGTLIWERQLNTNKKFKDVDSTPILDKDRLYVSSFDGSLYCLELASGKVVWKYDEGGYTPPLVVDESLYYATTTRKLVALDKRTGKEIWKLDNLKGIPTGPGLMFGKIFFGESGGDLKLVNTKDGKLTSSFRPGRGLIATPTFNEKNKLLYFMSSGGNLVALRLDNPTL
jgi:outer membrane protein assembly factor BamB